MAGEEGLPLRWAGLKNMTIDNEAFYQSAVDAVAGKRKQLQRLEADNFKRICKEEYSDLSRRLDAGGIQSSAAARAILRTRRLANLLINDKGVLDKRALAKIVSLLEENLYFLGPEREHEIPAQELLLRSLKLLGSDPRLLHSLQSISKPQFNQRADEIIRQTLQLPEKSAVTDAHARRAALAAWLCYLRQTLGSCFATAPALLVHDEQPEYFFENIREILGTGKMTRTFGGIEYVVPLSGSWGPGDLKRPFILPSDPAAFLADQPGIVAACEEAGILDSALSQKKKQEALQALIAAALASQGSAIARVEELIQALLRNHYKITLQDLDDYQNRPRTLVHGSLMLQNPEAGRRGGGKGQACAEYLIALERAKNGFKAITDNALLKSWEFTLASFAETKAQFARWNLYSSLGFGPEENGGIGACLYNAINSKLQYYNRQVEEYHEQYSQIYVHVKAGESRMRNVSSEEELRWARLDYQSKLNELHTLQELRDSAHRKAQRYAALFDYLINAYIGLFPRYFQEVYDAEMMDVGSSLYDDSPAGFRLLYKHGRSNSAQWSPIGSPQEFIDALASFFMAAEREFEGEESVKGMEKELIELTSEIVNHVRSDRFLESALQRMAIAHGTAPIAEPLKNLNKITKKPWVYTSGGNMNTLLSCYFRREEVPQELSTWVETPVELLVFLIDTLKQTPAAAMRPFLDQPNKGMLIHSPTHAFVLKPGLPWMKEAWQSEEFTYTWIRDRFVAPMEWAISQMRLNDTMMEHLVRQMLPALPENSRPLFLQKFGTIKGALAPEDFSQYIAFGVEEEPLLCFRGKPLLPKSRIDSVLFSNLPLSPYYLLHDKVQALLSRLPGLSPSLQEEALSLLDRFTPRLTQELVFSCKRLQEITLALIALATGSCSHPHNYPLLVKQACLAEGYSLPMPFLFADTNWPSDWFAFLVNPGSGQFELWRTDLLGNAGAPMEEWKEWLNGSRQQPKWGLFPQTNQYVG